MSVLLLGRGPREGGRVFPSSTGTCGRRRVSSVAGSSVSAEVVTMVWVVRIGEAGGEIDRVK